MTKFTLATALISAGLAGPAAAALVVTPGNTPQNDSNVIYNACSSIADTTTNNIAYGCLQTDQTKFVSVVSDEPIEFEGGGQARVEAVNSSNEYSYLRISFLDGTPIQTLILNINSDADAFVRFFAESPLQQSDYFSLNDNGNNFFTITGGPFDSVSFRTYSREYNRFTQTWQYNERDVVEDTRQIRIGMSTPVPLPGTAALLGLGFVGLAGLARRRA